jgi:anti-sigma regulatory factor (Ser/Thr protein kinase)
MTAPRWTAKPPPHLAAPIHEGTVSTPVDLTMLRSELHRQVIRARPPQITAEDVDRLLLTFEELASNGLRHGRHPIRVIVTQDDTGWLVDVSDGAPESPPSPALGRDPAEGGLGLYLIARLSSAYGWWIKGTRKHVWALIRPTT